MIRSMSGTGRVGVALLGSDLILSSRLESALAPQGVRVARAAEETALAPAPVVFIDLNSHTEGRLQVIGRLHSRDPKAVIVGFCDHDERDVRRRAVAAGAHQVVANRHLAEAAARIVSGAALRNAQT